MIVADTNLIVYLLVEGDQTVAAKACGARNPFWIAPAIWRHELLNALSQHARLRGLTVESGLRALALADNLIETVTLRGFDRRVIQLASERKMASYDAEFLAAAELADAPLVTADQALINKSDGRAISIDDFAAGR